MVELEKKTYIVNGYEFHNEEDYSEALTESNTIKHINGRLNGADVNQIEQLYCQLIEKNTFHTQVGLEYLHRMRHLILKNKGVDEDIPNVQVYTATEENTKNKLEKRKAVENAKSVEKHCKKLKERLRTSIILNVVLVIVVIAMFVIASSTSTPNILNYERKIQDKYSAWAEQLKEKEEELRIRENGLE